MLTRAQDERKSFEQNNVSRPIDVEQIYER